MHVKHKQSVTGLARNLWGFLLVEGILLVLLGFLALALPPLFGFLIVVLLGWLLMVSGSFGLITTLLTRHAPGFLWSLLSALLAVAIGAILFAGPKENMVTIGLALGIFLALDGLFSIAVGFEHRRHLTPKWSWLVAVGVMDLVFAGGMIVFLPEIPEWLLGMVVGGDLLVSGAALIMMAMDVRISHARHTRSAWQGGGLL